MDNNTMKSRIKNFLILISLSVGAILLCPSAYAGDGVDCDGIDHDRCGSGSNTWHCYDAQYCKCNGITNERHIKYDHCGTSVGSCGSSADLNCGHVDPCLDNSACCSPDCSGKNCGGDGCGGSCGTCPPDGYAGARFCSGTTVQQIYRTYVCSGGGVCLNTDVVHNLETCVDEWLATPAPWCVASGAVQQVWGKFRTGTCTAGACDLSVVNDKYYTTCDPNAVPVVPSVIYCDAKLDLVQRVTRCPCKTGSFTCDCAIRDEIIGSCLVPLFKVRYNGLEHEIAGINVNLPVSAAYLPLDQRNIRFRKNNVEHYVLYGVTTSASASKVMARISTTPNVDRALLKYSPPKKYVRSCTPVAGYYGPSGPTVNCGSSPTCAGAPPCTYGPVGAVGISCVLNCP